MGRFSEPSPFSQRGTSNLYQLGFTAGIPSDDAPRWSRSAAKRKLRLAGQTKYMSPARLGEILQLLSMNRYDLAGAAGINVGLVKDWLDGRRDVWPKIGIALEVVVKSLYGDYPASDKVSPSLNHMEGINDAHQTN
jgi:hypothetical protein